MSWNITPWHQYKFIIQRSTTSRLLIGFYIRRYRSICWMHLYVNNIQHISRTREKQTTTTFSHSSLVRSLNSIWFCFELKMHCLIPSSFSSSLIFIHWLRCAVCVLFSLWMFPSIFTNTQTGNFSHFRSPWFRFTTFQFYFSLSISICNLYAFNPVTCFSTLKMYILIFFSFMVFYFIQKRFCCISPLLIFSCYNIKSEYYENAKQIPYRHQFTSL